jgi:hypothetical protein
MVNSDVKPVRSWIDVISQRNTVDRHAEPVVAYSSEHPSWDADVGRVGISGIDGHEGW